MADSDQALDEAKFSARASQHLSEAMKENSSEEERRGSSNESKTINSGSNCACKRSGRQETSP